MIELRDVSMSYGRDGSEPVLHDLDLRIDDGELVLLCGASGCGKSSVLRLLNGVARTFFDAQVWGDVLLDAETITDLEPHDIAQQAGSVFQNPKSQFFTLDVTSELAFGCENLGVLPEQIRERITQVSQDLNMEDLLDRQLFQLSGGQKQKVACAAVAAMRPRVLLLDEPSSNLDLGAIDELHEIVARWKSQGRTVVVAEHRLSYLVDLVDRVVLLEEGRIARIFTGDEFRRLDDGELQGLGLRSTRSVPEQVCERPPENSTMTLDSFTFTYPKSPSPALSIPHAELPAGQVIAVVGRNGAGKTTFVRSLTGLETRARGRVRLGDQEWSTPRQRLRHSYLVMQDVNHQLFGESVDADITIGVPSDEAREARVAGVLDALNLLDKRERHPMSLSGGERQRVAIATALLCDQDVIVFDEPTSGLDLHHMRGVARLLDDLARQGRTVLVVTHDVELLAQCCHTMLLLDDGHVTAVEPCSRSALEQTVHFLRSSGHAPAG